MFLLGEQDYSVTSLANQDAFAKSAMFCHRYWPTTGSQGGRGTAPRDRNLRFLRKCWPCALRPCAPTARYLPSPLAALSQLTLEMVNFDEASIPAPAPPAAAPPFLAREARMAPRNGSFAVIVAPTADAIENWLPTLRHFFYRSDMTCERRRDANSAPSARVRRTAFHPPWALRLSPACGGPTLAPPRRQASTAGRCWSATAEA